MYSAQWLPTASRHAAAGSSRALPPAGSPGARCQSGSSVPVRQLGTSPRARPRRTHVQVHAISIDRRKHLDMAWQRQQQAEHQASALQGRLKAGTVLEIKNLQELEAVTGLVGSDVLVVFFYSRSCGSCKSVGSWFDVLCSQARKERASVTFAKHDVRNEYDDVSDVSRFYSVKAVPAFVFFVDGAPVRRVTMRDIRRLTGSSMQMKAAMHEDLVKLSSVLREVLFRNAPSART